MAGSRRSRMWKIEAFVTVPSRHCFAVARLSPTSVQASGSGGSTLAGGVSIGSVAVNVARMFQSRHFTDSVDVLASLVEDHVPAPNEEEHVDGETFAERLARFGTAPGSGAW